MLLIGHAKICIRWVDPEVLRELANVIARALCHGDWERVSMARKINIIIFVKGKRRIWRTAPPQFLGKQCNESQWKVYPDT